MTGLYLQPHLYIVSCVICYCMYNSRGDLMFVPAIPFGPLLLSYSGARLCLRTIMRGRTDIIPSFKDPLG